MKQAWLSLACFIPMTIAFAGNAGGTGGNSYLDELKGYRAWSLRILAGEQRDLSKQFGYSEEDYTAALKRLEKVVLVSKQDTETEVNVRGEVKTVKELLPAPVDELFKIDGEIKDAVNLTVDGVDLIIFDPEKWDRLDGKISRKLTLVGHELFGILKLEKTGESTFSSRFEGWMARYPRSVPTGIAVVPLWRAPFETEVALLPGESCASASIQDRIRRKIGEHCQLQIPNRKPSPYFDYECVLEAAFLEKTELGWKTTVQEWKGYVPGLPFFTSSYFGRSGSCYFHEWEIYRRAHLVNESKTETVPVRVDSCRVSGTLHLTGIDPINGDEEMYLIKSSNPWEEGLSNLEVDPQASALDKCFHYRKKVRKGLVNRSHCRLIRLAGDKWRWELWAVHPYKSSYKWSDEE